MTESQWVGTDEWGGTAPSEPRKDLPPPPFWRLEAVTSTPRPYALSVSPDRSGLCFLLDRADAGCDVWMLDLARLRPTQVTVDRPPSPFWEDTVPRVSPDGRWIAYASDGHVRVAATSGGPSRPLCEGGAPVWMPDGRLLVLVDQGLERLARIPLGPPWRTEQTRLAMIDPDDPWPHPISAVSSGDVTVAVPSPSGSAIAVVVHPASNRNRSDILVIDVSDGGVTTVAGIEDMHAIDPQWRPDAGRIAYVSEAPGRYQVFLVDPDGSNTVQLTDEDADFFAPMWRPDGTELVASRWRSGRADLVRIDIETGTVRIVAVGGSWTVPDWLTDGTIVALYEDHGTPARIERVDGEGNRTALFEPAPAPIRSAPHVTPEEVAFRSNDGLEIHGFLFRPRAASRPAPAVVYPHGGPTSVYGDEWDGHAQYFVDKGYAWFAINYRGSTTYGRDFERSNHGVWGVDDTEDCLAAAGFLSSLDWIDERRIAIFGASYGSYLALCSLVADGSSPYACGVAKYGDCDILTSWAQSDREGSEDLERMMGHPAEARAAYAAGSPIHRLDAIDRPILVAHGELDERVHPRQSAELVAGLRRFGKNYEYITYPTEGHGLLRRAPQLHFYRRLERFLDWYLM